MATDPDTILNREIVDHEQLAVAMLDRHYRLLHFVAYSILGDADWADDAVQETIIRALDKIDQYRVGGNMKGWLSAIVVNQARSMLRRRRSRERIASAVKIVFRGRKPRKSAEEKTLKEEIKGELWLLVDELGDKHRLPIILRYLHELSVREIAQMLGVREGTIHSRLHYACRKLGGRLAMTGSEELIKELFYE